MAAVAVVRLEGVLAQTRDDLPLVETEARVSGLRLAAAMLAGWHVVIVHAQEDRDKARHWLRARATGVAREVTAILHEDERAAQYGHPDVWVTADPEDAAEALSNGISTLLVTDPVYTRAEMRPDAPTTLAPWGTVVEELDRQRALLATDKRLNPEA